MSLMQHGLSEMPAVFRNDGAALRLRRRLQHPRRIERYMAGTPAFRVFRVSAFVGAVAGVVGMILFSDFGPNAHCFQPIRNFYTVLEARFLTLSPEDELGTTDEEIDISKGDLFQLINNENSDWWYVRDENDHKRVGYVPRTYIATADKNGSPISVEDKDDAESQDGEKVALKNKVSRFSVGDRGRKSTARRTKEEISPELPIGCTESVLSAFKKKDDKILSRTLCPVVDSTGSGFVNLSMDQFTKRVRTLKSVPAQCTIGFSVIEAKNIESLIGDRRVLGRHIRMAVFDNKNVLSNVHSIPAINAKEFPSIWRFSSKASLLFPKDDENTCFLRTNEVDLQLCILFELCALLEMSETKVKTDMIEVSVGWGMLPLFTSDGTAVENKSYDIKLFSGSPFSKDAFAKDRTEKKTFFQILLHGNKHPRLNIKVWKLGQSVLDEIK
ncbi:Nephrocystin-1 [Physocladia obscura]|uniref:Nephrocystin-1 n=1 Tax=Physocladia obscura TaxID=109957 RepID=A0AAD5T962_9FUNG|nr:Nephrocystin-1 [Physocladia obscura]